MLKFNGLIFVRTAKELVKPVIDKPIYGLYKINKSGYRLYKPDGELMAFIKTEFTFMRFAVSAWIYKGRPRYQFALMESTREWLKLPESLLEQKEILDNCRSIDNLEIS